MEIRLIAVRKVSETEAEMVLPKPKVLSWVGPTVDVEEAKQRIMAKSPPNGRDIVPWMVDAAAYNSGLDVVSQAYKQNKGKIDFHVGDAYYPGVKLDDNFYFGSREAAIAASEGVPLVTPCGTINMKVRSATTVVCKDFLGWAAIPYTYWEQVLGILIRFTKLAKLPIENVPFLRSWYIPPQFFLVSTRIPTPIATMRLVMFSSKDSKMVVKGRHSNDYRETYFETEFDVRGGTYEYLFSLSNIPYVPEFVIEMQPIVEKPTKIVTKKMEIYP